MLNEVSIEEIARDDLFELIDQRIISELIRGILDDSVDEQRLNSVIKQRESKYWFERYRHFYNALSVGFNLLETIRQTDQISIESFDEGIENYTKEWYQVDQDYRLFIEYYRETNQNNVLNPLYKEVNKAYNNNWLLNLSDGWQNTLDKTKGWNHPRRSQTHFFRNEVKPFINQKTRLFVIISDALRYECGVSFQQKMQKENRFESSLDYQITSLALLHETRNGIAIAS